MDEKELVAMLDQMVSSEVSRIKIDISEELAEGEVQKKSHHGRCDVGSPYAKGTLTNFGCE